MSNPKVFLGSSNEAHEDEPKYASLILEVLAKEGITPLPWWHSQTFPTNVGYLESLIKATTSTGAALLIATPDDKVVRRGKDQLVPRDNVMLEYGLFTGAHGRDCVAIAVIGGASLPRPSRRVSIANSPKSARSIR